MSNEGREELELERCERDLGIVESHLPPGEVDRQPVVAVALLRHGGGRGGRTPEQGLYAGKELLATEGLDDVVVGPCLQTAHSLELAASRGEHQHRYVADIPDPLERLPAVHFRHRHVENDEVGRCLVQGSQTRAPILCLLYGKPGPPQQLPDETSDIRVVVDYEHPGWIHTSLILNPRCVPYQPGRQ